VTKREKGGRSHRAEQVHDKSRVGTSRLKTLADEINAAYLTLNLAKFERVKLEEIFSRSSLNFSADASANRRTARIGKSNTKVAGVEAARRIWEQWYFGKLASWPFLGVNNVGNLVAGVSQHRKKKRCKTQGLMKDLAPYLDSIDQHGKWGKESVSRSGVVGRKRLAGRREQAQPNLNTRCTSTKNTFHLMVRWVGYWA